MSGYGHVPQLPALTGDTVVLVADVIRTGQLVFGAIIFAVAVRASMRVPQIDVGAVRGLRLRIALIALGTGYICLTAYSRLGMAVTVQLPVGVLYELGALVVMHLVLTAPRPPSRAEERLASFERPSEGSPERPRS